MVTNVFIISFSTKFNYPTPTRPWLSPKTGTSLFIFDAEWNELSEFLLFSFAWQKTFAVRCPERRMPIVADGQNQRRQLASRQSPD